MPNYVNAFALEYFNEYNSKKKSFFPISCSFFSICKEFVVIMNHFNWNGGIPKMGSSFNYNDENFWIHSKKHSNKKEFLR